MQMILSWLAALLALVAIAGCGAISANTTSTDVPTTATSRISTTVSNVTREALIAYRQDLHDWYKQGALYTEEQGADFWATFFDPLDATSDQITALKEFVVEQHESAGSFGAIQPPEDMLNVHQAFGRLLSDYAREVEEYVRALEQKDAAGLESVLGKLSATSDRLNEAQVELERAAGTLLDSQ